MSSSVRRATAAGSTLALAAAAILPATAIPANAAPTATTAASLPGIAARTLSPRRALIRTTRQAIVNLALSKQGASYAWGASGPDAFDCSGFVMWVYQQATGAVLPHFSGAQMDVATPVTGPLRRGDLLFYGPDGSDHVSIYIGRGMQVGANNPRTGVMIDSVADSYWAQRYVGAARITLAG